MAHGKLGLVVEGGGAKGAFAAGAIAELLKRGVTFGAIAGTSAGALNALLAASMKPETVLKEWRSVTGAADVIRASSWLRRLSALPLGFWNAWLKGVDFTRPELGFGRRGSALDFLLAMVSASPVGLWGLFFAMLAGATPAQTLLATLGPWLLYGLVGGGLPSHRDLWQHFFSVSGVFVFLVFASLQVTTLLGGGELQFPYVILPCAWGVGLSLSPMLDPTLFQPDGLRARVAKYTSDIRARLFVTSAIHERWFDPDHQYFLAEFGNGSADGIVTRFEAQLEAGYVPQYRELNSLAHTEIVDACMASAALPFGIFPPVNGSLDGGVVDNVPYYPLIKWCDVDTIVVIRLTPEDDDLMLPSSDALRKARWQSIDRLVRVTGGIRGEGPFGPPDYDPEHPPPSIHNDPPVIVPIQQPPRWPRVVVIRPTEDLGGLFAILDFSPTRIEQLLQWGQEAASRAFEELKKHCQPL